MVCGLVPVSRGGLKSKPFIKPTKFIQLEGLLLFFLIDLPSFFVLILKCSFFYKVMLVIGKFLFFFGLFVALFD